MSVSFTTTPKLLEIPRRAQDESSYSLRDVFSSLGSHQNTFEEIFGNQESYLSFYPRQAERATFFHAPTGLAMLNPDILSNIVANVSCQSDLVSLSATCETFYHIVQEHLYRVIYIMPDNGVSSVNSFTVLKEHKYALFLRTLVNNPGILTQIRKIVIFPGISTRNNAHENLYDLITASSHRPISLVNLDLDNIRQYGAFLSFASNRFNAQNNIMWYEQPGSNPLSSNLPTNSAQQRKAQLLESVSHYDLVGLGEINELPLSTESISYVSTYGSNYFPTAPFNPSYNGIRVLYNLSSLSINHPKMAQTFIETVLVAFQNDKLERVRLRRLSIAAYHTNTTLQFRDLVAFLEISYLHELEIRSFCDKCSHCVLDFFEDWKNHSDLNPIYEDLSDSCDVFGPLAASLYAYLPNPSSSSISSKSCDAAANFKLLKRLSLITERKIKGPPQLASVLVENWRYLRHLEYLYCDVFRYRTIEEVAYPVDDLKALVLSIRGLRSLKQLIIPDYLSFWYRSLTDSWSGLFEPLCQCEFCHEYATKGLYNMFDLKPLYRRVMPYFVQGLDYPSFPVEKVNCTSAIERELNVVVTHTLANEAKKFLGKLDLDLIVLENASFTKGTELHSIYGEYEERDLHQI